MNPWHCVAIDSTGPWKTQFKKSQTGKMVDVSMSALEMIDQGTNYPDITSLANKESECIAKKFDNAWLCRHPCPSEIRHNNGGKFTGHGFQQILHSYTIKSIPTAVNNSEEKAIIE